MNYSNSFSKASLQFLTPSETKPVYYASEGGADATLSMQGLFEMHDVEVLNARTTSGGVGSYTLDKDGFSLINHKTVVTDFYDMASYKEIYENEIKSLVKNATGASRTVVFDHTLRSDSSAIRGERNTREPSAIVHNDYTENSGPKRVRDILPDEADSLLKKRFAIINVWRGVHGPVIRSPLALCTAVSQSIENLIPSERRAKERIGELMLATYNPNQQWVYFPNMQLDEALLIKTFDSSTDGRARYSIHTAFTDPKTPEHAPPRESIESRLFAFFD